MLGVVKCLFLISTGLLFFDALQELDWGQLARGQNIKAGLELMSQGKELISSFFDAFPWFTKYFGKASEIKAVAPVSAIGYLAIRRHFSFSEVLGQLISTSIAMGLVFALLGYSGGSIVSDLRSFITTKSWCLAVTNQIDFRRRNFSSTSQGDVSVLRQEFDEANCARYGLRAP